MDPWGTPAVTGSHLDDWPFKTTLWNLWLRKLWISSNGIPVTICFMLYISPSCHTLSKAFDTSDNTPLTSRGGLQSKDAYISSTTDRSWYLHESDGLHPGWFSLS